MNELYPPYDEEWKEHAREISYLRMAFDSLKIEGALSPNRFEHYLLHFSKENQKEIHNTTFRSEKAYNQMICVPNIQFWSACSHHLLPFFGSCSIGYYPGSNNILIGLSKIALYVREWARGFWMQEDLTEAIADDLYERVEASGVAVMISAQHTCQLLDLGQPPIPFMTTMALRGCMYDEVCRAEFLGHIGGAK